MKHITKRLLALLLMLAMVFSLLIYLFASLGRIVLFQL